MWDTSIYICWTLLLLWMQKNSHDCYLLVDETLRIYYQHKLRSAHNPMEIELCLGYKRIIEGFWLYRSLTHLINLFLETFLPINIQNTNKSMLLAREL